MSNGIGNWVEDSRDEDNREFREAVHTILFAITSNKYLRESMILKGGILLAIKYESSRYTKDIDFSTDRLLNESLNESTVRKYLDDSLAQTVETLDYDLDCRVQSCKLQPKDPNAKYPSIKIKIGYAYKGTNKHKKLIKLRSSTVISIDYSLNESTPNIENFKLDAQEEIQTYSLIDLIAEKYRSLLQQVSRNRNRRQDVYDLNFLIAKIKDDESVKKKILQSLIEKSKAREIKPCIDSFFEPGLKSRAKKDYSTLADEIDEQLPDFETLFDEVGAFYQSLPWST